MSIDLVNRRMRSEIELIGACGFIQAPVTWYPYERGSREGQSSCKLFNIYRPGDRTKSMSGYTSQELYMMV